MFRHILIPLDGSLRAERAIPVAARIAHACEGMLILQRTVSAAPEENEEISTGSPLFQTAIQSELAEFRQYLTGIASASQLAGLPVIVSTAQGSVMATIQETIQRYQADLLVCCEQREPQGSHRFLGSFAEHLSQHLSIPLLLLPEQEPLHHTWAEWNDPITCLVAFAGSQPEPFLIQPAASLLAALSEHEPGHLHCVSLREAASLSVWTHLDQHIAAPAGQQRSSGRRAVLLQEAQRDAKSGGRKAPGQNAVCILGMPLQDGDDDALREMCRYPRLLVPSPVRES